MRFKQFKIKNFKGIEDITINLEKSPKANIYTLVGLNESGKTTILEAINFFSSDNTGPSVLDLPGGSIKNYNDLIPINKRDNFNDFINIGATLSVEDDDLIKINEFAEKKTNFHSIYAGDAELNYSRKYKFENSNYKESDFRWSGLKGIHKKGGEEHIHISDKKYSSDNSRLAAFCRELIPKILYFPNFLFDFPSRINLESSNTLSSKESFYISLIQDILNSLQNATNIKEHLLERIRSNDKRSLNRLIQLMERKVTEVVFDGWKNIFKRSIDNTRIIIDYGIDDNDICYLEFEIESDDGIYQINERSLGFRWFFTFLLFTQFRPYRVDEPQNVIFLFDEPASNLHPYAQKQLLTSFEKLTSNSKIIYTTHSHHMINPKWLESTYVVKNEGLDLTDPDEYNIKKTKIIIDNYRDFAANHPHNTAYFQPILDVLDYSPSDLERLPNCVFLEGKNDFYTLKYFQDVVLSNDVTLNLSPSTGSGNLDVLISLYIGWGKEFIILLDSDDEGKKQKVRYIENFGMIVEGRIFTLSGINTSWDNCAMESLIGKTDKLNFQKSCYPSSTKYNKTHFNRAMQENLIKKQAFEFEENTISNFKTILDFLSLKINT